MKLLIELSLLSVKNFLLPLFCEKKQEKKEKEREIYLFLHKYNA